VIEPLETDLRISISARRLLTPGEYKYGTTDPRNYTGAEYFIDLKRESVFDEMFEEIPDLVEEIPEKNEVTAKISQTAKTADQVTESKTPVNRRKIVFRRVFTTNRGKKAESYQCCRSKRGKKSVKGSNLRTKS
jgi:hypothetical protein